MTIGQWNLMSKITILNLLIVRFFWRKKKYCYVCYPKKISGAVTQFTWQILKNSYSRLYVVDGEYQCHGSRSISTGSITSVSTHPLSATGSLPLPRRNHAPALLTLQSLPPPPPPPSGKIDPALVKLKLKILSLIWHKLIDYVSTIKKHIILTACC